MLARRGHRPPKWAYVVVWVGALGMGVATSALGQPSAAPTPTSAKTAAQPATQSAVPNQPNARPTDAAADESQEAQAARQREAENAEFYELLKLFTETLDQIDRNYVKDVSRRELMEAAIRGMMSKLDQHSNYIPPNEMDGFRGSVENEFGGIGIQVAIKDGRLTIISPLVGTPAYRAGLQAGDWVAEIEGTSTRDMTIDDAVKKMKGPIGSEVRVTVVRGRDGEPKTYAIRRETIKVDTVLGDRRGTGDSWDYMLDEPARIGYIRITSFGRQTAHDVEKVVKQLVDKQLRGLIIDLRFNPGGLLSGAIAISDLFVSDGTIVSTSGRNTPERVVRAVQPGTYENFPIAVLVNRYSASASEIVSACLQDHKRAVVVGERTWGKGSVQNIVELEQGRSAIKLTTAGYLRPNGRNIDRAAGASEKDEWGVKPDDGYELKLDDDELKQLIEDRYQRDVVRPATDKTPLKSEFVDRQLQKALEYVKAKADQADPAAAPATP